jgi:hypothetical protein
VDFPEPITPVDLNTETQEAVRRASEETHDPRADRWDSEVQSDSVDKQLKQLVHYLQESVGRGYVVPDALIDPEFSATALRPPAMDIAYRDESTEVRRSAEPLSGSGERVQQGTNGFFNVMATLTEPYLDSQDVHFSIKTFRIESEQAETARTRHHFSAFGRTGEGSLEQHATWHCEWAWSGDERPLLRSIDLADYEEAHSNASQGTWFSDCTKAVLAANDSFHRQLQFGLGHWLKQIERVHLMDTYGMYGMAVGDVNGDGLDDVYVCQPGGLPNRLYVQNPDGTATDRSAWAGVDWLDHTGSALLVDLDNDGDQDLAVATYPQILIQLNDSTGRFTPGTVLPLRDFDPHSFSAVDYDNDGDLDLYLCVELATTEPEPGEVRPPFAYHDANDGGANVLYRSLLAEGRLAFEDVTEAVGLDVNNRRHSLAAAWEDFDNDGDQDLYVGNDYGKNCLYRNDGGRFVDIAEESGVLDQASGMSVSWGDADRDGRMDLCVANMYSYAGSRITRQEMFQPNDEDSIRSVYQRFAKGNSLFRNRGGDRFEEVSAEAAVEMGRWAWSSLFADINNDGWEDLVVVNGYISSPDTADL